MKKKICLILSLVVVVGCGFTKWNNGGPDLSPNASQKVVNKTPEWYNNPPNEDGYSYATAQATSQDAQIAIDKAKLAAKSGMASNQQAEMNGYMKRVQEETGLDDDSELLDEFSNTQEQVTSYVLEDIRVARQETMVERTDKGKKIYRAYILIEFDEGARDARLLSQIERNQKLYDKIRATELVEEMESKVDAYRKRMEAKSQE